jgi:hypothetical protein
MLSVVDDARDEALDGHAAWSEAFNEMFAQVAGVFGNARARRHGRGDLLGLLSHQERKNSWWLAEFAGEASPDGMRTLPGTRWPGTWRRGWAIPPRLLVGVSSSDAMLRFWDPATGRPVSAPLRAGDAGSSLRTLLGR